MDILLWTLWVTGTFIIAIALLPLYRENKKVYTPLGDTFLKLMVFLAFFQLGGFVFKYSLMNIMGFQEPILPKNVRIDMIVSFGMLALLLHFSLFATGKRRHYSLPWVWFLFVLAYLVEVGDVLIDIPIITSAMIAIGLIVLFFSKAIKNRSGLMLGIGLYVVTNLVFALLNNYTAGTVVFEELYNLLGLVIGNTLLALSTWDIYERYLLYDRKKEREIKSSWISKIMQVNTNSKISSTTSAATATQGRSLTRRVTCPVCKAAQVWKIPENLVDTFERSQKGVFLVKIPVGTTCEHDYALYLDRSFQILGYSN
ncbi:MAG: hypothetical protein Q6373_021955 [Candidatus Sigynarchaeota archaeon]